MSLLSSIYTGVSGLQSYGDGLQVVGDNIANVSTVGFKGSRAEFAAMLSQSVSGLGGTGRIGRGVALDRVTASFSQGSFSSTDRLTDLGINGAGFFVLSDGQSRFYTRSGQFSLDNMGYLVSPTGLRVQGNVFDANGIPTGIGDLRLNAVNAPPQATSDGTAGPGVQINMNLDASEAISAAFDASSSSNAQTTSNFSTTITVYDSLGNAHPMTVYLRKDTAADPAMGVNESTWQWYATVDGAEIADPTAMAGVPFVGAQGTVTFDVNGNMTGQTTTSSNWDFTGGAAIDQAIGFDFTGTTQFASASTVRSQSQDGYSDGTLSSIDITEDGIINGFFSNGQDRVIGQIILADFANPQGLSQVGSGLFRETIDSGAAVIGDPNSGGLGTVASYSLELSNVDLADEFVSLVTMQRAFQANSKIISTVDELLNELVNIIR